MIPFLDLGRLHASIRDELEDAFDRVVTNSSFIGGKEVADFERALADMHGRTHAVGCASGTDALALTLRALGVKPGDEVVVPAMTFVATAEAVLHAGAVPLLADVDPETLLLSPATVAAVRTAATRVVMPVHLYGHVTATEHMQQWREDGLLVLEDAAQAVLAHDRGCVIGTIGAAATLSFYPGKNLGALGDAGAILTDDEDLAAHIRRQRDHGRTEKYAHAEIGFGSRLDALQAAFLAVKLGHLPAWTARRRALAERYRTGFAETSVSLVPWTNGAVHHLLCIRVERDRRDEFMASLKARGIGCGLHYPLALSQQPALAPWATPCPGAERAAGELVSLPIDPLMELEEVDEVVGAVLAQIGD